MPSIPINLPTWRRPRARRGARNIKLAKLFSLIIVVAAAFVGGFAVRGDAELLDTLGLTQLTGTQDAKAKAAQTQQTYNSLSARVARWRPS